MGAGPTSRSRIVLAVHRVALRTGPRLGCAWALAYRAMARAATAYLTRGEPRASAYVRGGIARDELVPGLSDVDTAVVLADDPAGAADAGERARRRWDAVSRTLPFVELVVERPTVYGEADLRDLAGTSALTYGLDAPAEPDRHRAGYFGTHASFDWLRTLERPGLHGVATDWRRLTGPDRRPAERPRDPQLRRIVAWLELLYWWRWVYPVCIDPTGPRTAALCVKLIAEPTRIWLWLAQGECARRRADALEAGLRWMPEEEPALRRALDLQRSLPRSPPPPLREVLPPLVRISARIAERVRAEVRDEGATEVRLTGADPAELILAGGRWQPTPSFASGREAHLLPLADWRALVCPLVADESFALLPGDAGDPAVVAEAAASQDAGAYPALRAGGLILLPAAPWWRSRLRAVKCAVTDPASFALADGDRVARFPNVRGWSAHDTARRAVAEHLAWLRGEPGSWAGPESPGGDGHALAMLLSAARAAVFLESIRDGGPELPLTVAETVRCVAMRSSAARTVAEEALERYREFALCRREPPATTVSAMRRVVLDLPSYGASAACLRPYRAEGPSVRSRSGPRSGAGRCSGRR
jgi:predicted nucleotidyltransferase